jgi:FkbM family methyltransferase
MSASIISRLLHALPRRALTGIFGHAWRVPLVKYASSPLVYALPGDTVVLGGCYKLETVRSYVHAVGPRGRVIAIEANPDSVARLRQAIAGDSELRDAGNVTIIGKGVWSHAGVTTFVENVRYGHGYDRITEGELSAFQSDRVEITDRHTIQIDAIDNMLAEIGVRHVDYVVLTVNDSELPALDGLARTIEANPALRLYIHSVGPEPLNQVERKLRASGFRLTVEPVAPGSRLHRIYAFSPHRRDSQRAAADSARPARGR